MGMYYRVEVIARADDPEVRVVLAPSCAMSFFTKGSETFCMWVTPGAAPMQVHRVSVINEDELERDGVLRLLDVKYEQPRKKHSV